MSNKPSFLFHVYNLMRSRIVPICCCFLWLSAPMSVAVWVCLCVCVAIIVLCVCDTYLYMKITFWCLLYIRINCYLRGDISLVCVCVRHCAIQLTVAVLIGDHYRTEMTQKYIHLNFQASVLQISGRCHRLVSVRCVGWVYRPIVKLVSHGMCRGVYPLGNDCSISEGLLISKLGIRHWWLHCHGGKYFKVIFVCVNKDLVIVNSFCVCNNDCSINWVYINYNTKAGNEH